MTRYCALVSVAATVLVACSCPYQLSSETSKQLVEYDANPNPAMAPKFSAPKDHWRLVSAVLDDTARGRRCLAILRAEQLLQDTAGVLSAPVHFDNCTFDEGLKLILKRTDEGNRCVEHECWDQALGAYGAAIHTVQDFYAHSNWVELGVKSGSSIDDYANLKLWTETGGATVRERAKNHELLSGYSLPTVPHDCPSKTPTHSDLGKESANGPPGSNPTNSEKWCNLNYYDSALRLASIATVQYFADAFHRYPQLSAYCDVDPAKLDAKLTEMHVCPQG
jgi:hypothetical protein